MSTPYTWPSPQPKQQSRPKPPVDPSSEDRPLDLLMAIGAITVIAMAAMFLVYSVIAAMFAAWPVLTVLTLIVLTMSALGWLLSPPPGGRSHNRR